MNRTVKEIIYILIAIMVGILVFRFIMWLLPIFLIGIIVYTIYKSMKNNYVNVEVNKDNRSNKKKPMKVIHDLDDED